MRLFKSEPLNILNSYVVDSPQPANLSYSWNFGSLLALSLVVQIITGVTLAMHYNSGISTAFESLEHIMRNVDNGWFIRYLHANTASAFFLMVYCHVGRGLYYGSYKSPKTFVWIVGTVLLIFMMGTAFLGYVLPFGQMSLWGATVITNLLSAIPWIGPEIVLFIWGGFSVGYATLSRFFSLHYLLPFTLAAFALIHLNILHARGGSGNPLGCNANGDRLAFAPYFIFKDIITIFIFIIVLAIFVFFYPNTLGDSENYVMANPMQTPSAIVPEWYLLPFYAILRSVPDKLVGVICMFVAILALIIMPFTDISKYRGTQFKPAIKLVYFLFACNFLILMSVGAKHVESPFIQYGQVCTVAYFIYFLGASPFFTAIENCILRLSQKKGKYTVKNFNDGNYGYTNINNGTLAESRFNFYYLAAVIWVLSIFKGAGNFIKPILSFFDTTIVSHLDAPTPWGVYFQDSGSPQMEGLVELHDHIFFYLIIILFGVSWILTSIIKYNAKSDMSISHKNLNHGTTVELIWTVTPAIILILIAFPSFKLLYLMDEVSEPAMVILAEGHQWYWSYQYADFMTNEGEFIEYDSYLVPESDLDDGALRMLEVDNRLVIPELTHVRFVVGGADVIHSFACPSLGLKCDAYPGRLNQTSLMNSREGVFYGQCSEICGILHSSMPIVIQSVPIQNFVNYLLSFSK